MPLCVIELALDIYTLCGILLKEQYGAPDVMQDVIGYRTEQDIPYFTTAFMAADNEQLELPDIGGVGNDVSWFTEFKYELIGEPGLF
jgi:hypothetical protein